MANLLTRGNTWFARFNTPRDRWEDSGFTMATKGGVLREIVRTLRTTDHSEALKRRDVALAAMRTEVDIALRQARKRPLEPPAQVIADLYKRRWAIDPYFRWIKQTLAIRKFVGTSENAIRT